MKVLLFILFAFISVVIVANVKGRKNIQKLCLTNHHLPITIDQ